MPVSPPPGEEPSPAPTADAAPAETAGGTGRENGQRLGLRFRRGSRAPMRPGEIPLIGVVKIEPAAPPVAEEPVEPLVETSEVPKRARPRRAPRKRVATEAATSEFPEAAAPTESPPTRRPRTRSRKKPE
jgi:hypothetical protein